MRNTKNWLRVALVMGMSALTGTALGSEQNIRIPPLDQVKFSGLGGMSGVALMYVGLVICLIGAVFGLVQYKQTKGLPVHKSMANVSNTIWETCKTYLFTQGKFLAILWGLIAVCMTYYFGFLTEHKDAAGQPLSSAHVASNVIVILLASVL